MNPWYHQIFWITSLVLAGLTELVNSQSTFPAKVPVPELAAKVGYSTNFTCGSYGVPIFICIWERQKDGKKLTISINEESVKVGTTPEQGYEFYGPGFDKGSCGIFIKDVKEDDNAVWDCKLITLKATIYQGAVRVGILKKPHKPEFSTNVGQLNNLVDTEPLPKSSVTCGSYGGQPPPKLKWFVGNDEVTEGLQPYENTTDSSGHNWIYQTLENYKFRMQDNGKNLRCLLVHDALSENDPKEVAEKITVFYKPQAQAFTTPVLVPTTGKDFTLWVNVSANPPPQVAWRIADKMIVPPLTTKDKKYTAYNMVEVSPDLWAVGLQIQDVQEEDLAITYKLEARNLYGNAQYDLRIDSKNPEEGGGVSAGGIVGLVLGIPALLIIIAVIVVYTRAQGLLCFKGNDGTASEKERMDRESGGVGAAVEEKPTSRRLSSRLSAFYENLVSKKKEKTTPVEEEPNKGKEKECVSEELEKKPEDIVYAELDLVNEGSGKQVVRCADDKTEYAEIIGVVPQGTKLEDTSKDKSPLATLKTSPKK